MSKTMSTRRITGGSFPEQRSGHYRDSMLTHT